MSDEWQNGLTRVLYVSLGGVAGANLRYGVGLLAERWFGAAFPWGTLGINAAGSFALGLLHGWLSRRPGDPTTEAFRLLLGVGFLGAFTTFSTFSLETVRLLQSSAWWKGLVYVLASVALGVLSAGVGMALAGGPAAKP